MKACQHRATLWFGFPRQTHSAGSIPYSYFDPGPFSISQQAGCSRAGARGKLGTRAMWRWAHPSQWGLARPGLAHTW